MRALQIVDSNLTTTRLSHVDSVYSLQQLGNTQDIRTAQALKPAPAPAPAHIRSQRQMIDSHGRTIRDMRISITDRCNFRCVYCMEPDVRFASRESLLTTREIIRMARIGESLGIRKIRLTGGEPTLHPELTAIINGIRESTSVEIAMITNASLLTRKALREWHTSGLDRITISIDSLRRDRFARLTRSNSSPEEVVTGIKMCIEQGLQPVKLNAVLIRGFNDDEAIDLAQLARDLGIEMRFIEYMPLDSAHAWDSSKWVSSAETREAIERSFQLISCDSNDHSSTARTFKFADGSPGGIGFISPVSSPFCGACSRVRLTADGKIRPCLFSTTEWDVLRLLRTNATDEVIANFMIDSTWTKQATHGISSPNFHQPERSMSAIGG